MVHLYRTWGVLLSVQKNVKAFGGRGMYPGLLCVPDGHCLCVGVGTGVSEGGIRVTVDDEEAVGFNRS